MAYTLLLNYAYEGGVPASPYSLHDSMADRLDPEYVAFFNDNLRAGSAFLYTHRIPLSQTRAGGNIMPGQLPLSKVSRIYDVEIPRKYTEPESKPVPARVFVPLGDAPKDGWPLFVWFHGGGWVLGNISTENSYCTKVASIAKCVVLSVDYRLAPEDPFPAAVNDAFEAVLFGLGDGSSILGTNKNKVAVGGSSAGGNLTATIAHELVANEVAKGFPPILLQLLVVPVTDNTATPQSNSSWKLNEMAPQLSAEKMLWYRTLYLPDEKTHTDPRASPLFYPTHSFSKVAPAFIAAAQCDVLCSEAELYHKKLQDAGVESEIVIYPGVPHPVMAMDGVLAKGRKLVADTTSAIHRALYSHEA